MLNDGWFQRTQTSNIFKLRRWSCSALSSKSWAHHYIDDSQESFTVPEPNGESFVSVSCFFNLKEWTGNVNLAGQILLETASKSNCPQNYMSVFHMWRNTQFGIWTQSPHCFCYMLVEPCFSGVKCEQDTILFRQGDPPGSCYVSLGHTESFWKRDPWVSVMWPIMWLYR